MTTLISNESIQRVHNVHNELVGKGLKVGDVMSYPDGVECGLQEVSFFIGENRFGVSLDSDFILNSESKDKNEIKEYEMFFVDNNGYSEIEFTTENILNYNYR